MTQMTIGQFRFALGTAQYQSVERTLRLRWQSRERLGAPPLREFQGADAERIRFDGTVWVRNVRDLAALEALAKSAVEPQPVYAGGADGYSGEFLGYWVVDEISRREGVLRFDGVPARVDFTVAISEAIE